MRAHGWALVVGALVGPMVTSCTPPHPPGVDAGVAAPTVRVDVQGTHATLTLAGVVRPLRSLQVGVSVQGGRASAVRGLQGHDVVEAGLAADAGGLKAQFTVVVADSQRRPMHNGALAELDVDSGVTLSLHDALAVDADGVKVAIDVVTH